MKSFQFSTHDSDLPPQTRFFTTRMLITAAALTATILVICRAESHRQLAVNSGVGCLLGILLAAFYGATSRLSTQRKVLLATTYFACFSIFVAFLALFGYHKIGLALFNESDEWSPLPPEMIAGPMMFVSSLMACFFGYVTLKLSNIVEKEEFARSSD